MDLLEAMQSLRAVRRLRPDPIPEDMLQRVLTAATWAPTGGNVQPWRMVVVRAAATKRALQQLYAPRWFHYVDSHRDRYARGIADDKLARTVAAGTYLAEHLHEAPVIVVFCHNPSIMAITDIDQPRPTVVGGGSIYPAVQNLLLAARAEGLGCVLTTLLCMDEPAVRTLLGLPDDWYTAAHVPLGWPVGRGHGPIARRPLAQMAFGDRWGDPL